MNLLVNFRYQIIFETKELLFLPCLDQWCATSISKSQLFCSTKPNSPPPILMFLGSSIKVEKSGIFGFSVEFRRVFQLTWKNCWEREPLRELPDEESDDGKNTIPSDPLWKVFQPCHSFIKSFRYLKWRKLPVPYVWLFWGWGKLPYISRIHKAYIGEDSSILGTWNVGW